MRSKIPNFAHGGTLKNQYILTLSIISWRSNIGTFYVTINDFIRCIIFNQFSIINSAYLNWSKFGLLPTHYKYRRRFININSVWGSIESTDHRAYSMSHTMLSNRIKVKGLPKARRLIFLIFGYEIYFLYANVSKCNNFILFAYYDDFIL